jgi:thiol-disulfide isomerase/thioredoxin
VRHHLAVRLLAPLLLSLTVSATAAPVAELELSDLEGLSRSVSELKSDVVLVNFWATWCIPCRKEMPLLSQIHDDYEDRGVRVLGAAAHPLEETRQVRRDARRLQLSFPTWLGATTADMERLGLGTALPASLLLDRDGRIVATIRGEVDDEEMRGMLDRLLAADGRIAADAEVDAHDHFPEPEPEVAHGHDHDHDHGDEAGEESEAAGGDEPERPSLVPS